MKVLSNCSVTKLREYSQSYGSPEILNVPYIKEFANEIWLCNECGEHTRTMKKGTKLLISFTGKEITQRQLTGRVNKAILQRTNKRLEDMAANQIAQEARQLIADQQAKLWAKFLADNPESKAKYIAKCESMSSSKWRNYLRMKAAKHINGESFQNIHVSAPQLKYALFN